MTPEQFATKVERYNYRLGTPLSLTTQRRDGVCRWFHQGYIKGGREGVKLDCTGINVGKRDAAYYCLACHRSRAALIEQRRTDEKCGIIENRDEAKP